MIEGGLLPEFGITRIQGWKKRRMRNVLNSDYEGGPKLNKVVENYAKDSTENSDGRARPMHS